METVLVILYVVLIFLNGINAGREFRNNKPGCGALNIVGAVLWGVLLVLRTAG